MATASPRATHRYGFTDRLTGEAHGELQLDQQTLALGGSYLLGEWGVVSGGLGAGHSDGGPGVLGQLAYEYDGRRFSFGARTRYTSDGYREAGGDEEAARVDQLNLGLDFGARGRAGLILLNRGGRDTEDATTLAATYSLAIGPGSLSLRAAQLFRPDDELALTAIYTIPLGPRRSASVELLKRSGDYGTRGTFRQTRGASDLGLDYRLAAEAGTRDSSIEARLGYQSTIGAADLAVERFDGDDALRAGVNGSIALVDGEVAVSRRIDRAFGLVEPARLPRCAGLSRQSRGRPHRRRRPPAPARPAPLRGQPRAARGRRPAARRRDHHGRGRGGAVRPQRHDHRLPAGAAWSRPPPSLLDGDGAPLPVGLRLRSADGAVTAWVARDGFTQIKGAGRRRGRGRCRGGRRSLHLPAAAGTGGRAAARSRPGDMPLMRRLWPVVALLLGFAGPAQARCAASSCPRHLRRRRHHAAQPRDRRGRGPLRRPRPPSTSPSRPAEPRAARGGWTGPGGSRLDYRLFSDAGRSVPWGDGGSAGGPVAGSSDGSSADAGSPSTARCRPSRAWRPVSISTACRSR